MNVRLPASDTLVTPHAPGFPTMSYGPRVEKVDGIGNACMEPPEGDEAAHVWAVYLLNRHGEWYWVADARFEKHARFIAEAFAAAWVEPQPSHT